MVGCGGHRDRLRRAQPQAVQRRHVLAGQDLEQVLVAGPAGRIAGAASPACPGSRSGCRPSEAARPAPGPPSGCARRTSRRSRPSRARRSRHRHVLAQDRDRRLERLRPVGAVRAREAPRVAGRLQVVEQALELRLEAALDQHQVPPHVDDLRDVLDENRARLHAGPAGRAVPEDGVRDDVADELERGAGGGASATAVRSRRRGRRRAERRRHAGRDRRPDRPCHVSVTLPGASESSPRALLTRAYGGGAGPLQQLVAEVEDQQHRRERLARSARPGRRARSAYTRCRPGRPADPSRSDRPAWRGRSAAGLARTPSRCR